MRTTTLALSITLFAITPLVGCSSFRASEGTGETSTTRLIREAREAEQSFRRQDASLRQFFESSYGYAIFPRVAKGAAGIGAAHGDGVVYQGGSLIGYADLTQVNIGFQLGGQSFSQIIFFEDRAALNRFKSGDLEFSANASAVATTEGAAASNDYETGVAVFSLVRGGLMFEASIGGQDFGYEPVN